MGISDLYLSIGQKRNVSHFANIVRIAKSDHKISPEEIAFLAKISKKFNISDTQFKEIFRAPELVPTLAHLECTERIERLYDLLLIIRADHDVAEEEVRVLRKIVTGLAFPLHRVDEIVDAAVMVDPEVVDVDAFTTYMRHLMGLK